MPPMQLFVDPFTWGWSGIYFVCAINYAVVGARALAPGGEK